MGSACVKSILTKCSRTLMDEDWAVFPLLLQWENFCFKEWAVCIVCICPSYIFIPIYIFILSAWKKEPLFVGINSLYSQLGTIVYWRGHTAYLGTVWLIVRFFTFLHLIKAEEEALGTFQIPSHVRGGKTGSTLTGTSLCWSSSWGLFWHFEAMTHWGGVFLWFEPGGERSHSVYTVDMVYTVDTVYTVGIDIYHKYQKLQNTNETSVCKNGEHQNHHYWYLVPITHLQRGHWWDDVLYTSQN